MERRDESDDRVQAAAEEMEASISGLEQRSEQLDEQAEGVRRDWERKRDDPSVPGAEPRDPDEAGGEVAGDWSGEGDSANRAGQ